MPTISTSSVARFESHSAVKLPLVSNDSGRMGQGCNPGLLLCRGHYIWGLWCLQATTGSVLIQLPIAGNH